ncbi:g8998 [Coccomyxa viridis]|uniref:G8998 protein n=1 Tax=Coccomyxa viridis TaxID=1274662 RepID=A0ABP1G1T3_9CHLO
MSVQRLRVLALHGFRTSGEIFAQQMDISRLSEKLKDLIDIVYVDAPHLSSGELPADLPAALVNGRPTYEWWNAQRGESGKVVRYDGFDESLTFIKDYIALHGPFDGLWAFSQGTILASLLLAMQQKGLILQEHPPLKFIVCIGGVIPAPAVTSDLLSAPIPVPSLHIVGDRDYIREYSLKLAELFQKPVIITHRRGHVVPGLDGEQLQTLQSFLQARMQDSTL